MAHAVETVTGYGPVLHGEAVAYGTAVAVRVALARRVLARPAALRIAGLLHAVGLPVDLRELPVTPAADDVIAALDKIRQVRGGSLRFVLPTAIGSVLIVDDVRDDELRAALDDHLARPAAAQLRVAARATSGRER